MPKKNELNLFQKALSNIASLLRAFVQRIASFLSTQHSYFASATQKSTKPEKKWDSIREYDLLTQQMNEIDDQIQVLKTMHIMADEEIATIARKLVEKRVTKRQALSNERDHLVKSKVELKPASALTFIAPITMENPTFTRKLNVLSKIQSESVEKQDSDLQALSLKLLNIVETQRAQALAKEHAPHMDPINGLIKLNRELMEKMKLIVDELTKTSSKLKTDEDIQKFYKYQKDETHNPNSELSLLGNWYIERAEHAQRLETMRENLRKTGQAKFSR